MQASKVDVLQMETSSVYAGDTGAYTVGQAMLTFSAVSSHSQFPCLFSFAFSSV